MVYIHVVLTLALVMHVVAAKQKNCLVLRYFLRFASIMEQLCVEWQPP